jgi:hypothetical protein
MNMNHLVLLLLFACMRPLAAADRVWGWVSMRPGVTFKAYQPRAAQMPGECRRRSSIDRRIGVHAGAHEQDVGGDRIGHPHGDARGKGRGVRRFDDRFTRTSV